MKAFDKVEAFDHLVSEYLTSTARCKRWGQSDEEGSQHDDEQHALLWQIIRTPASIPRQIEDKVAAGPGPDGRF
jgi:hypothetical protein